MYLTSLYLSAHVAALYFYYYEFLANPPPANLLNHPPFLIISGVFFFSAFFIPLSFSAPANSISDLTNVLILIRSFAYLILFTSFIIAIKCQIKINSSSSSSQ